MAAADNAVVAVEELTVHGWDLARATDQPITVADPTLDEVDRFFALFPGAATAGGTVRAGGADPGRREPAGADGRPDRPGPVLAYTALISAPRSSGVAPTSPSAAAPMSARHLRPPLR